MCCMDKALTGRTTGAARREMVRFFVTARRAAAAAAAAAAPSSLPAVCLYPMFCARTHPKNGRVR